MGQECGLVAGDGWPCPRWAAAAGSGDVGLGHAPRARRAAPGAHAGAVTPWRGRLRCVARPRRGVVELTPFAVRTPLKQPRRVRARSALRAPPAVPARLAAPEIAPGAARRSRCEVEFGQGPRRAPTTRAGPAPGGTGRGACAVPRTRRAPGRVRSTLQQLTRRGCLTTANEVSGGSSAPDPGPEHPGAVGAWGPDHRTRPAPGAPWGRTPRRLLAAYLLAACLLLRRPPEHQGCRHALTRCALAASWRTHRPAPTGMRPRGRPLGERSQDCHDRTRKEP